MPRKKAQLPPSSGHQCISRRSYLKSRCSEADTEPEEADYSESNSESDYNSSVIRAGLL